MDPAGCRQLACKTIKIKRGMYSVLARLRRATLMSVLSEQDCASLMKEVRLLQALNHVNLIFLPYMRGLTRSACIQPNINKVVGNERIGKSLYESNHLLSCVFVDTDVDQSYLSAAMHRRGSIHLHNDATWVLCCGGRGQVYHVSGLFHASLSFMRQHTSCSR